MSNWTFGTHHLDVGAENVWQAGLRAFADVGGMEQLGCMCCHSCKSSELARLYAQRTPVISRPFFQFNKIKMSHIVCLKQREQMGWPFSMAEESGGGHATPWP